MSVDRSELHELVDELPDDQVAGALAEVRRRAKPQPRSTKPFAWVGMITDGPTDAASPDRIDELLARGFGRD